MNGIISPLSIGHSELSVATLSATAFSSTEDVLLLLCFRFLLSLPHLILSVSSALSSAALLFRREPYHVRLRGSV